MRSSKAPDLAFGSSGEKLQNLVAEPFENELVQIASDLRYLETSYEELDSQEKLVGTLATIRSEGWQKKMTILAAVFAAAGLGQLITEDIRELRTGVFFVSLTAALFVIWLISREK